MVLPIPLTPAQVGGSADVGETQAFFTQGPHKGMTLLVSMTDPNLHQAIAEGSVIVPLPITGTAPTPPPANTALPTITGTPEVGQTLTVSNGTWTGSPTFARQWMADSSDIAGATGATYVLQAAQVAMMITCRVTGTNAGGNAVATSAAVGPVTAAP